MINFKLIDTVAYFVYLQKQDFDRQYSCNFENFILSREKQKVYSQYLNFF